MDMQRLDKAVAQALGCTRSEAKDFIKQKKVSVGGKVVPDCAYKFDADADRLLIDGDEYSYERFVYFVMNKPKGVLSASHDKRAKTVLDLLSERDRRADLFCVGRLDKDTTGLLIITNDGDTAHKLMSPKNNVNKTYLVALDGTLSEDMIDVFGRGITLADGTLCKPAKLEIVGADKALLTIGEGKYHQVKRMFGVVGLGVTELKRTSVGSLELPIQLNEGEYVKVEPNTVLSILD